jgi:hypothetical protein
MANRQRPFGWRARFLSSNVHRECGTADGRTVSIWAYPYGIPPRSWGVSFAPAAFVIIQDSFAYLRYRIKYRGAWVVEIREHSAERVVAERIFPNRSSAIDQFTVAQHQSSRLPIAEIGQVLDL